MNNNQNRAEGNIFVSDRIDFQFKTCTRKDNILK